MPPICSKKHPTSNNPISSISIKVFKCLSINYRLKSMAKRQLTKAETKPMMAPTKAETKKTKVKRMRATHRVRPVERELIVGWATSSAVDVSTIATASFSIDSPKTSMYRIGST